jgi:2-desacetyl-2-hydroxyethyl bacteriochlorophyllide A dehydrogenase
VAAYRGQHICWPQPGETALAELELTPEPGQAVVEVTLSVSNPGTERARYLQLPNASIGFPHVPGFGSVGRVVQPIAGLAADDLVAIRCGPHQSVAAVAPQRLHRIADGTEPVDAALWQLGLIAMHGLGLGAFTPDEPLTVVGAGLIGAIARRVAIARGTPRCAVVAASAAKRWTISPEPQTKFLTTDDAASGAEQHPLVIDATGTAEGLAAAMAVVSDGGRIVLLGSPRCAAAAVPMRQIFDRKLRLIGAHIDTLPDWSAALGADLMARYTEEFFALVGSGRLTAADLVTTYAPGQAEVLYRQLAAERRLVGAAVDWSRVQARPGPLLTSCRTRREPWPPLRFGLVGCGDIGAENARTITQSTGCRLVACCDSDPSLAAGLADDLAVRATTSLADLLSDPDVEAVIVATPHDTHEPIAVDALAVGKHVLLQKPLAADLPAAQRIARAAADASSAASVLLPGRYSAAYRFARQAWSEGLIGRPAAIVATYLVNKNPSYYRGGYSQRAQSDWRLARARSGGGILIMNLLHHLDLAHAMAGTAADWVFARTAPSAYSAEIEDFASVMVGFGDVTATFVGAASVLEPPGEQFRVWGPQGHCVVLPAWQLSSRADSDVGVRARPEPDDPEMAAIDAFASAVRSGVPPDVTIEDALAVQALVAAGYESARTGQPVDPQTLLQPASAS